MTTHHHIFRQDRGTLTGELVGAADTPYSDFGTALRAANTMQAHATNGRIFYVTTCHCIAGSAPRFTLR